MRAPYKTAAVSPKHDGVLPKKPDFPDHPRCNSHREPFRFRHYRKSPRQHPLRRGSDALPPRSPRARSESPAASPDRLCVPKIRYCHPVNIGQGLRFCTSCRQRTDPARIFPPSAPACGSILLLPVLPQCKAPPVRQCRRAGCLLQCKCVSAESPCRSEPCPSAAIPPVCFGIL